MTGLGAGALTTALDRLMAAARAAGLEEGAARAEGEAFAAAVAEHLAGAFAPWCEQTGRERAAEPFMEAASRGRRYRVGPTPLMGQLHLARSPHASAYEESLADVATAALLLGAPDDRSAGIALSAMTAQRDAAAVPAGPREPVRGVGDELVASLTDHDAVRRILAALTPPDGQQPITPPTPDQPTQPTQGAPAEPASPPTPPTDPEPPAKTVEELLGELDGLVGLGEVKAEIHRQAAVLRVEGLRQQAGLTSPTITRHLVFNGNPGTGKTTVARLVAGIYRALGLLSTGQLVEVDRSELVAGYLGQTALKTAEVVASAVGGVLFVDEAYALAGGPSDQYGTEAVDTLVKEMEDHRDDLVVIVAGYPLPMQVFIAQNPGLASRFRTTIDFPDYTDDELVAIFSDMAGSAQYDVDAAVLDRLRATLAAVERGSTFGNARHVRNLLEAAIGRHAWRLREVTEPTLEQLRRLLPEDLDPAPGVGPSEPADWAPVPDAPPESPPEFLPDPLPEETS